MAAPKTLRNKLMPGVSCNCLNPATARRKGVGGARENGALEEKSRDGQGSSKAKGREGGRRCSLAHRRRRRWTVFLSLWMSRSFLRCVPRHSTPRLQNTQVGPHAYSSPEFVPCSSTSSTKMDDIESPPFGVM